MGWWSTTIMGGDTPLDAEGAMYNAAGVSGDDIYDGLKSADEITALVRANVPAMINVVETDDDDWYPGVYAQVLGVMVMRHGCDPKDPDVKRALEIAKGGAENDDWDDDERRTYIKDFIAMLEKYNGVPVEPNREGLFEAFEKKIAKGENGLVNIVR